eukprot:GCRY01003827.1.p1 GENE.GCRY01003827.1~~GCRY01003827.1.p1  ORF type:complete len:955 (+),score=294.12 GCRY01003827.1:254-3118(+)
MGKPKKVFVRSSETTLPLTSDMGKTSKRSNSVAPAGSFTTKEDEVLSTLSATTSSRPGSAWQRNSESRFSTLSLYQSGEKHKAKMTKKTGVLLSMIFLVLFGGISISTWLFFFVGDRTLDRLDDEFEKISHTRVAFMHTAMMAALSQAEMALTGVELAGTTAITVSEFNKTLVLLDGVMSTSTASWLPRVLDADRASFESAIGTSIKLLNGTVAPTAALYYPVLHELVNGAENVSVRGYDMTNDPNVSRCVAYMLRTGGECISNMEYMEGGDGLGTMWVHFPYFMGIEVPPTEASRTALFRGFLTIGVGMKSLFLSALKHTELDPVGMMLYAFNADGTLVYAFHDDDSETFKGYEVTPHFIEHMRPFYKRWPLLFYNQQMDIIVIPTKDYLAEYYSRTESYIFTSLGFFMTAVLTAILLSNFSYSRSLEVDNKALQRRLAGLHRFDDELDLTSPLEKALDILRRQVLNIPTKYTTGISEALKLLSASTQVNAPTILNQVNSLDEDTQKWLVSELASKEKAREEKVRSNLNVTQPIAAPSDAPQTKSTFQVAGPFALEELDLIAPVYNHETPFPISLHTDMFKVKEISNGHPLYYTSLFILWKHNFIARFDLNITKLKAFLTHVEQHYGGNPYHNSTHAADVLNTFNYLMMEFRVFNSYLSELDLFAGLFAAIVHDYGHPGTNNAFQIQSQSELAIRYNDQTILENHHVSSAFDLLRKPDYNFLENFDKEDYVYLRSSVIEMVLATDMARHFDQLSAFTTKCKSGFDNTKVQDKQLIQKIGIKISDIAHSSKKQELHVRWSSVLETEFFKQGDKEREMGFEVSAFMDRTKVNTPKSQVGFLKFVVLPLFDAWGGLMQDERLGEQVRMNLDYWQELLDGAESGRSRSTSFNRSRRLSVSSNQDSSRSKSRGNSFARHSNPAAHPTVMEESKSVELAPLTTASPHSPTSPPTTSQEV